MGVYSFIVIYVIQLLHHVMSIPNFSLSITPTMVLGWIATACTLIGFYFVTYSTSIKRLHGFITCAVGDIIWIAWALVIHGVCEGSPIIIVNVAMLGVAVIGIKRAL